MEMICLSPCVWIWRSPTAACDLDYSHDLIAEDEHAETLARLAVVREKLMGFATGERSEIGAAYVDLYAGRTQRRGKVVAETWEGMGIVVPRERYRPLSRNEEQLRSYLCETNDPLDAVQEARERCATAFRARP